MSERILVTDFIYKKYILSFQLYYKTAYPKLKTKEKWEVSMRLKNKNLVNYHTVKLIFEKFLVF